MHVCPVTYMAATAFSLDRLTL